MSESEDSSVVGDISCWVVAAVFVVGLLVLAVRLKGVQVDGSARYLYENARQSVRRVQTAGPRGRILDRNGRVLAGNRLSVSIVCNAAAFQKRTWSATTAAITSAISRVSAAIGRPASLSAADVARHVNQRLSRPLVVWFDVGERETAILSERADEFPGFACIPSEERTYPHGSLAAHVIGYVGRTEVQTEGGDENFYIRDRELYGREGLERVYDDLLRGVPGETKLQVDARGFATSEWVVQVPKRGLDLPTTLDLNVQRAVERELRGLRGACVVLDPRNGDILAMASAPTFDLSACVPVFPSDVYGRLANDPAKPLLNRAANGCYAPGSTFKPVTALAALSMGIPASASFECIGVFALGKMRLHCTSRWGHGDLDLRHALMKSCNPFFCHLGYDIGTNALLRTARAFGLGAKTGVDLAAERAGLVPDAAWKMRVYNEPWRAADLVQMSIGQGMLLTTPLQMARVAGAIATGSLVTPHFRLGAATERKPLPFARHQLDVVREGMRLVVTGDSLGRGTGRRGGEGVAVPVAGKTGTAEVGPRDNRRKNTWFIAYAPATNATVAVAMVIENGESGGGTTAPHVAAILKEIFNHD